MRDLEHQNYQLRMQVIKLEQEIKNLKIELAGEKAISQLKDKCINSITKTFSDNEKLEAGNKELVNGLNNIHA